MTDRGEILWDPPVDASTATAAGRFAARYGFDSYQDLHQWSIVDLEGFWRAVADDAEVIWRADPERTVARTPGVAHGARWFPGSALNYAEHALRRAATDPDGLAVVGRSQTRGPDELTWADLSEAVARCAAGLRRLGVERGDRVVAYAPNVTETLVAFLASASIGAVWASCPPEFGTRAVIDRLAQLDPTVLVAVDGYVYGTKRIDRRPEVRTIRDALPSLRHVVSVPYLYGDGPGGQSGDAVTWADLLAGPTPEAPTFEALDFDHPLYVLFSSGTTGLPKAIVHGHGGITLEHLKVLRLHQDLGPEDRFAWFTTTGWMMWNYLVSGLLVGSTLVLFDGDPGHPDLGELWRFSEDTACTVFGVSAAFLMASRKAGLEPSPGRLRWVGSTGSPLPPAGFRWVRDSLGVPVSSISGGTDVCTAFVGSSPLLPVRAGEISGALLGCAVQAYDEAGRPVPAGVTGELVITEPMPSMPVGLWGDDDGSRYRATYFEHFDGVWRHGDWITIEADGACTITGRSDATLNRGGVRLGTSDFYTVVETLPEVVDSLVVHRDAPSGDDDMGELLLFVQLAEGCQLDDALRRRVIGALRAELSPRHVPDSIEAVPSIPRTLSGKKTEIPAKRVLAGTAPEQAAALDSLADPRSLDWFAERSRSGS